MNGGRVRAEYKLGKSGDEVRIPPARINAGRLRRLRQRAGSQTSKSSVIVRGQAPARGQQTRPDVAVHGGSGISHGVIELLRAARPEPARPGPCYIDSIARPLAAWYSQNVAARCASSMAKFRDGTVEKNYLALVIGDWQFGEQICRCAAVGGASQEWRAPRRRQRRRERGAGRKCACPARSANSVCCNASH